MICLTGGYVSLRGRTFFRLHTKEDDEGGKSVQA
jgi:hypothetical protein